MPGAKYGPENTVDQTGLLEQADQQSLGKGVKTASATAGAATLNQPSGIVTSESLTTAAAGAATYTLTLTNNQVIATDIIQATLGLGTNTTGTPVLVSAVAGAGSIVFKVQNAHPSAALNGTLTFAYVIWKA
jgi:hypothetical protein